MLACEIVPRSYWTRSILASLKALRIPPFSLKRRNIKCPAAFGPPKSASWSPFSASEPRFKIDFEKTFKKIRKLTIWASQSPAETLPKCVQNRIPKKHAIFLRFLLETASVAKVPTCVSYGVFPYKMPVGRFSSPRFWHVFWLPKTNQKTFQNDTLNLQKSMLKTNCFSTYERGNVT